MMTSSRSNLWLNIARTTLFVLAILLVALSILGISLFQDYSARHLLEYTPNNFWTSDQTQAALVELNWPAKAVLWYSFINDIIVTLISMSFAIFLLWRKSTDWFVLFLALVFMLAGLTDTLIEPTLEIIPGLVGVWNQIGIFGWQFMFMIFYLFPDGHFVPRWTRWMPFVWLGINVPSWLFGYDLLQSPLGLWLGIGLVLTTIGSQVYRYGWRSTPLQKQQTKWVVAVLAGLFVFMIFMAPSIFKPPAENALGTRLLWMLFGGTLFRLSFLVFPVTITIAILRYHLWDIDVIIRKTLVYGALTAMLAIVFFGAVTLLQQVFARISSTENSPIAIVLSTLAIAALFSPLRRRVQDFIDRRFYRRKYDAEQALAEFAQAARSETNIEQLSSELLAVTRETMQPEHASLWLRRAGKQGGG